MLLYWFVGFFIPDIKKIVLDEVALAVKLLFRIVDKFLENLSLVLDFMPEDLYFLSIFVQINFQFLFFNFLQNSSQVILNILPYILHLIHIFSQVVSFNVSYL
jgi:hypothetical protein